MQKRFLFVLVLILLASQFISAQTTVVAKDKHPVIFIPGVLGSRLINSDTGENVWVNVNRSKIDDLRLPMSPNLAANRDKLVANQVLEKIKILKFFPQISVYQGVVDFFEKSGYQRGDWENPHLDGALGDRDTYYLFAYDWRRDNVESAQKLIQQIDQLKRKLGKPDLKFDVIAHSMGGLVARYAAMYGRADLADAPKPTWEGTKYFHKICLFGVPNDGSMEAFDTILNGYSVPTIAGRRHIGVLDNEVALTAPSIFQLLPHAEALNFYDEDLQPMKIDIYDPATWKNYGWSAAFDEKFRSTMSQNSQLQMDKYFAAALGRAKKFHAALAVKTVPPPSLFFYNYGSDCKTTLDGAVVYKEKDGAKWLTLTRGESFRNSKGEKVSDKDIKKVIYTNGDGSVTKSSMMVENLYREALKGGSMVGNAAAPFFACEAHASLLNNKILLDSLIEELFKLN